MTDQAKKNNQIAQDRIAQFLRDLNYPGQHPAMISLGGTLQDVLTRAGQEHLLHLIRLRKFWTEELDAFLAKHAYPRNIVKQQRLTLSHEYLAAVANESQLAPEIIRALHKWPGRTFARRELLRQHIAKHLKRAITDAEEALWMQHFPLGDWEYVLHLTVYDGAFAQFIDLQMEAYLERINTLFKEIRIERIECQIGTLEVMRQDQIWVSTLADRWERTMQEVLPFPSMPAFVHRHESRSGTLVLYVPEKAQRLLAKERRALVQKVLQHLYDLHPELRYLLNDVSFFLRRDWQPQQTRIAAMLLGTSAANAEAAFQGIPVALREATATIPPELPERELSPAEAKQKVQEIIQRIKSRSLTRSQPSEQS